MPCPDCRGTDAGVVFCPYHSQMEQRIATLEAVLANRVAEERDEQRYALLQASATLMAGTYMPPFEDDPGGFTTTVPDCVVTAAMLLTEIEKREQEKQS